MTQAAVTRINSPGPIGSRRLSLTQDGKTYWKVQLHFAEVPRLVSYVVQPGIKATGGRYPRIFTTGSKLSYHTRASDSVPSRTKTRTAIRLVKRS